MAIWIRAGDTPRRVTPKDGAVFTLQEMQEAVGGYLEALRLDNGLIMWVNEEGKLHGLPVNVVADIIAHSHTGIAATDTIVGDVLLASMQESGEGDESEWST